MVAGISGCSHPVPSAVTAESAPTPEPVRVAEPEAKLPTVPQLVEACNKLGMQLRCTATYDNDMWVMMVHFDTANALQQQGTEVAKALAVGFCANTLSREVPGRFALRLIGSGFTYIDCRTAEWVPWVSEQAIRLDPSWSPAKMCQTIENDRMQPFRCVIEHTAGMFRLTLTLVYSLEQSQDQLVEVIKSIRVPYCDAVLRTRDGGLFEVVMPKDNRGLRYNCETQAKPSVFYLRPPAQQQQQSAPQGREQRVNTLTL
jgi:hypothetical protein